MRSLVVCLSLVVVCACNATFTNPPPAGRFLFPTGLAHVDVEGSDSGVLFVATSNWNLRFTSGSVSAVKLDGVGLPAFGAPVDGGPLELADLGDVSTALVTSFAGEMGVLARGNGKFRIFVPSRGRGDKLHAVDAEIGDGVKLSCFPAGPSGDPTNCEKTAPSLSPDALQKTSEGVPRVEQPYGVSVRPRACRENTDCGGDRTCVSDACISAAGESMGDVYVTHLTQVDSPLGSRLNYRSYLAHLESDQMTVDASSFLNIGYGAGNSAVTGARWTYVTGRAVTTPAATTSTFGNLLRLVDRKGNLVTTGLEGSFTVYQSRGAALDTKEERLFIVGQSPDVLLVVAVGSPQSDAPSVSLVHAVPLPNAPEEIAVISREGRGDLVAITCAGSYNGEVAGELALYDEDVGALVAHVPAIGIQPFGVTVDHRGNGARLFVSNFGDGRVAVIDIPDLFRPQDARLVAHLGQVQRCLTLPSGTAGCEVSQ